MAIPLSDIRNTASLAPPGASSDLWRPAIGLAQGRQGLATGHGALDRLLSDDGWPPAGMIELLLAQPGSGELGLLLPLLARLSRATNPPSFISAAGAPEPGWLVWIDPPLLPFAPALAKAGVALAQLLVLQPKPVDWLWATQQAARASSSRAVLCWSRQSLRYPELRKLQVAASDGRQPLFLFRDLRAADRPSPAVLRLQLQPEAAGLGVEILKQRGGRHGERCLLPWPPALPPLPHPPHRDAVATTGRGRWQQPERRWSA